MSGVQPSGARGVAFRTLGCKVNRVESDDAAAELLGAGATIVAENEAGVVVVSTCAVTTEADAKSRKAVRQALSASGTPIVVVTGCGAALDPEPLRALGDRVVVEADKSRVPARVRSLLALEKSCALEAAHLRAGEGFRTRALLKVEDGCDAFCTYCIVPYARGVPRAVPLDALVADARALVEAGAHEIVLTGINIGRYSHDGADLAAVVRAVAATGVERLRLSSIEPLDLTPDFLGALADTPSFCPHLHVPLQSGSDAVLSAMGRRYTAEHFAERIAAAREALPGLSVTTDVLCAFPGETGEDAEKTLHFVESVGLSALHVFRYSPRPSTPAAEMAGRIVPPEAARRAEKLRACGERLRAAHAQRREGELARVLVERAGARGFGRGKTEDYLPVDVAGGAALVGQSVTVRLRRSVDGTLVGESHGTA